MNDYKLPYTDIRHGLDPEPEIDWVGVVLDAVILIALIGSLLVIVQYNMDRTLIHETNTRKAEYDRQERAWLHCLQGGTVDLGDELLDCANVAFKKKPVAPQSTNR